MPKRIYNVKRTITVEAEKGETPTRPDENWPVWGLLLVGLVIMSTFILAIIGSRS